MILLHHQIKNKKHNIFVIVDRLQMPADGTDLEEFRSRMYASFEGSLRLVPGSVLVRRLDTNEDILYSTIYNKNGICLVSQTRGNENIKKHVSSTPIESSLIKSLEKNRIQKDIISISKVGKVMDIMLPIVSVDFDTEIKTKKEDREIILGSVRIGVSLNEINAQKNSMIRSAILLTLFILFIGAIFSFFFVKIITKEYSSLGTNKTL